MSDPEWTTYGANDQEITLRDKWNTVHMEKYETYT
jgi:hypothetical protein